MATSSKSQWTTKEKLALCMAVIKQHKYAVKWQDLELPAGRTRSAAQFCFHIMKKEAEKVHMAKGEDIPDSKPIKSTPRKPKKASTVAKKSVSTFPTSVKRKAEEVEELVTPASEDEGKKPPTKAAEIGRTATVKRIKKEPKQSEDEDSDY